MGAPVPSLCPSAGKPKEVGVRTRPGRVVGPGPWQGQRWMSRGVARMTLGEGMDEEGGGGMRALRLHDGRAGISTVIVSGAGTHAATSGARLRPP